MTTFQDAVSWLFARPRELLVPLDRRNDVRVLVQGAAARRQVARGDSSLRLAAVSVLLLRDALLCMLRALDVAQGASTVDTTEAAALRSPHLDPYRDGADFVEVRRVLERHGPGLLDRESAEDLGRMRAALDRVLDGLEARIELRTPAQRRGMRVGRLAGLGLVVVYGLWVLGGALLCPRDVALGKPVTMSSREPGTPDPRHLVDGETGGKYGAHTAVKDGPSPAWITIDLQRDYEIRKIVVYNRGDGGFDEGLPFRLVLSEDGESFSLLAKRETHFGDGSWLSPPWTWRCVPTCRARYVRIESEKHIALSEIKVFGD